MMCSIKKSAFYWFLCAFLGIYTHSYSQAFIPQKSDSSIDNDRTIQVFEKSLNQAGVTIGIEPVQLATIVKWSSANNRSSQCNLWLEQKIQQSPGSLYLVMALADLNYLSENWRVLYDTIVDQNWLYQEHIRHAYLSIASRELKKEDHWSGFWSKAVGEVLNSKEKFRSLISLVSARKNWGEEIEDALWQQVEGNLPSMSWSLDLLNKVYQKKESLVGLQRINDYLMTLNPTNVDLMNNHIVYQVLSNESEKIDSELIDTFQGQLNLKKEYVLTYAFYLMATQDLKPLKAFIDSLPIEFISKPQHALYAAAILKEYDSPLLGELLAQAEKGEYSSYEIDYFKQLGLISYELKPSSSAEE